MRQMPAPALAAATTGCQGLDETANNHAFSSSSAKAHDSIPTPPQPISNLSGECTGYNQKTNDVLEFSSNTYFQHHGRRRHRHTVKKTYRLASCSSRGVDSSTQGTPLGAEQEGDSGNSSSSSSNSNNNSQNSSQDDIGMTNSTPITNDSSQVRPVFSSSPPRTPAGWLRYTTNVATYEKGNGKEEKGEESPLTRRTTGIVRPFILDGDDDNAFDKEEKEELINPGDAIDGGQGFGDELSDVSLTDADSHSGVREEQQQDYFSDLCYQRVVAQKNDEIADLTRRYERLEELHRLCTCLLSSSTRRSWALRQPRDERGRWVSSSSSSTLSESRPRQNGGRRRRRTNLELTMVMALRFGYPVGRISPYDAREELVPELESAPDGMGLVSRESLEGSHSSHSRIVGRRITREIWERRRGAGAGR